LNRFRAAFAALLVVAAATSLLAGSGLAGYPAPQSSRTASTTTEASSASASTGGPTANGTQSTYTTTSVTTTESTTTVSGSSATATATTTVTATSTSTTTVVSTTTTTTTTAATTTAPGQTTSTSVSTSVSPAILSSFSGEALLRESQTTSLLLAPVCWVVLAGMWMWRGRVRARYSEMGFGSDVFDLFMKMKGGTTRIKVLNTLTTPKDRLQLAQELGVDWKTIDRHVQILNKYGFVREQAAYGTVRLYEVTPVGKMLLNLFDDLERTDGPVAHGSSQTDQRPGS
jgi:hypothetical protein